MADLNLFVLIFFLVIVLIFLFLTKEPTALVVMEIAVPLNVSTDKLEVSSFSACFA